ncbi:MAG: penicillin-binding protein 2 [Fimbriimonadales bacterium]|nr:penicillin-binding protein 2 [Fimbriimonadales bacterium]
MKHRRAVVRTGTEARLREQEQKRLRLAGELLTLGGLLIVGRLFSLQVLQAEELREAARVRRERVRPLLARRGAILDRWGRPLAQTAFYYHLALDPRSVRDPAATARWLASGLGLSADRLTLAIQEAQAQNARYLRFATFVPQHRAEPFLQRYRETPTPKRLAVLMKEVVPARELPEGHLAAQLIGLTVLEEDRQQGNRLNPLCGLELTQNQRLQGINGHEEGEVAPGGLIIPETLRERVQPVDGQSVRLTLDIAIQEAVEQALDELCQRHRPKGALALVLDSRTGEILALANRPTFDPRTRKGLAHSMEPLRNRAITFLYEPGSTLKPVMVAAALDAGIIQPTNRFYCARNFTVSRKRINCVVQGRRHGMQTPEEVVKNSCNIACAQIGLRMGLGQLYNALKRFHLLEPTGVELPAEWTGWTDPPHKVLDGRAVREANLAFGQGVFVTPLALAATYTVFANEGYWVQPHLLYGRSDLRPAQVIQPETARIILRALVRAVEEGTGKQAQIPGYWIAGKTGTAQKAIPGRGYVGGKYIASFIGILPADNPRAIVMVLADEPRNGYYGGEVAAPTFRRIAQFLLWYWKIPPSKGSDSPDPSDRSARFIWRNRA